MNKQTFALLTIVFLAACQAGPQLTAFDHLPPEVQESMRTDSISLECLSIRTLKCGPFSLVERAERYHIYRACEVSLGITAESASRFENFELEKCYFNELFMQDVHQDARYQVMTQAHKNAVLEATLVGGVYAMAQTESLLRVSLSSPDEARSLIASIQKLSEPTRYDLFATCEEGHRDCQNLGQWKEVVSIFQKLEARGFCPVEPDEVFIGII